MRKYLHRAPQLVFLAGGIGIALRFWMLAGGTDDKNLYPAHHPGWIALCLFSILIVTAIWRMTRIPCTNNRYHSNFPPSVLGGIGYLVLATGIVITAWSEMSVGGSPLALPTCILGFLSAGGLYWAAMLSYSGKRTPFAVHALPCFYFALRVFLMGRILGAEPEISRFLFRFLAGLSLLPAFYQRWAFDVDLGNRRKYLFWNLIAGYFCLVAIPGSADWLFYLTAAVWLLTNLCALKFTSRTLSAPVYGEQEALTEQATDASQYDPESELALDSEFSEFDLTDEILKDMEAPTETKKDN